MVQGIGNDIIEIGRIRDSIERHGQHFLDKIFTQQEQEYCHRFKKDAAAHFAGRFAAKEAVVKALGTGFRLGITWLDIEVQNDEFGKPNIVLSDEAFVAFGQPKLLITITHCREYAYAVALLLWKSIVSRKADRNCLKDKGPKGPKGPKGKET